jgi:acylphosphatase
MDLTRHLRIHGRVQGVGYRDALRREALRHGLGGWVRNRRDGTVETVLQGEASAVEAVTGWARHGPPAARVDRVDRVDAQPAQEQSDRPYAGFEMLPTI